MVRAPPPPAPPAATFASAAARLAGRAVSLAQRLDDAPPSPEAALALQEAVRAAQELERLAADGADLSEAYALAARALDAASDAFESLEARSRPWLHIIRKHPRVPAGGDEWST